MKVFWLVGAVWLFSSSLVVGGEPGSGTWKAVGYTNELVGLCVKNADNNKPVSVYNQYSPLVPASVIKLVTTATALEVLGPDFRFETTLEYTGTLRDGVLDGDLIVRGGGDPTLGSRHLGTEKDAYLSEWVQLIRNAGIKSVKGRVVADAGIFDEEPISPFWLWEDIGNYYAPGIVGLGVNDNSVTYHFRTGQPGSTPELMALEPPLPQLQVENHLKAAANDKDSAYVYGLPYQWKRQLFGTMPANRSDFSIRGDLPDPPLYVAGLLTKALKAAGIAVTDSPTSLRSYALPAAQKRIGSTQSDPLSRLVRIIHEKSDNVYAECLLRTLASRAYSPPYSARQGIEVVLSFWKRKGLDVQSLYMVDGSGLSPLDRISPAFLADLLVYMAKKSPHATVFETSLPLAGVEGTVSSFLKDSPLAGRVRLKSGTNQTTTNYAGYYRKNNSLLVVVMLVNHTHVARNKVRKDLQDYLINR